MEQNEKKETKSVSQKSKSLRVGGFSVVATVIVLAIIIAANVIVNALPSSVKMIDLSQNLLYSFTEQTKTIVSGADRDVTIYMLCQAGYEDSKLTNLLKRYDDLSDRVSIVNIDTNNNPTFADKYELSEVSNNSVLVVSDLRYRYIDSEDIFEYDYVYDDDGNVTTTSASLDGEGEITSAINYCLMVDLPKVYTLEGHGETTLPDSYLDEISRLNLTVETLNLLTYSSIPDDCDTLMIIAPISDLSSEEYTLLSDYLDKGGRILLVTAPRVVDRSNLDKLMAEMNMKEVDGVVVEGDADYYAANYEPTYLLPEIQSHTITDPLINNGYKIFLPVASGLKRVTSDDLITVTPLLKTSIDSFSKIDGYDMTTYEKEDDDIIGSFFVAALSERECEDYSYDDAMVVWISSDSIINETVNTMVSGANMDLFLNSLSYICDQANSISIHSKSLNYRYLNMSSTSSTFWSIILIGVIPALCLGCGAFIFLRRRKK